MTDTLAHECELLHALLNLGERVEIEPFLTEVLQLARSATGADKAYLAIGPGFDSATPRWWRAFPTNDELVFGMRRQISVALLSAAARGGVIHTVDALLDERFEDRPSVRDAQIRAVLCAALRAGGEPQGVLYLAGPPGRFDERARRLARLIVTHLEPAVQRTLSGLGSAEDDPTRPFRARLLSDHLAGQSPAFAGVLRDAAMAATTDTPLLITGPPGSGKRSLARMIHDSQPARRGPFVVVDTGSLSADRAAAEVFGARRGAWPGLDLDCDGLVHAADGGTLYVDDVLALAPAVQSALSVLLEHRRVRRVGDADDHRAPDVRVMAATSGDPERARDEQRLRQDLYFQLNALRIAVPPLADRPEDVVPLALALVDRLAREAQIRARPLSNAACAWLESRSWPGNVQELQSVLRAGLVRASAEDTAVVGPEHLGAG